MLPIATPYGPNLNSVSAHPVVHHLLLTWLAFRGLPDVRRLDISAMPFPNSLYRFNFVNHQHHGTDPVKYGVEKKELA